MSNLKRFSIDLTYNASRVGVNISLKDFTESELNPQISANIICSLLMINRDLVRKCIKKGGGNEGCKGRGEYRKKFHIYPIFGIIMSGIVNIE